MTYTKSQIRTAFRREERREGGGAGTWPETTEVDSKDASLIEHVVDYCEGVATEQELVSGIWHVVGEKPSAARMEFIDPGYAAREKRRSDRLAARQEARDKAKAEQQERYRYANDEMSPSEKTAYEEKLEAERQARIDARVAERIEDRQAERKAERVAERKAERRAARRIPIIEATEEIQL